VFGNVSAFELTENRMERQSSAVIGIGDAIKKHGATVVPVLIQGNFFTLVQTVVDCCFQ